MEFEIDFFLIAPSFEKYPRRDFIMKIHKDYTQLPD